MALVPLYDGLGVIIAFARVDSDDLTLVEQFRWWLTSTGYAKTWVRWLVGDRKEVYMHRLLFGQSPPQEIDHVDGDTLNNTRGNLRACSHLENARNKRVQARSKSGYTGVYRRFGRWRASIRVHGILKHLGVFDTLDEAVAKRVEAECQYFGFFRGNRAKSGVLRESCSADVSGTPA